MDSFLAQIIMFGGGFAIRGFATCNGQLVPISQNSALYSLIGTTYGGDGRINCGLPDFRGRSPVGVGVAPGLSSIVIGERAGWEHVTLSSTQLPAHTHTATFAQTPGSGVAAFEGWNRGAARSEPAAGDFVSGTAAQIFGTGGGLGAAKVALDGVTVSPVAGDIAVSTAGASTPVNIRNPYLGMNLQISMAGIYPSRS